MIALLLNAKISFFFFYFLKIIWFGLLNGISTSYGLFNAKI